MNNDNTARANELAIKVVSGKIHLTLEDPADKWSDKDPRHKHVSFFMDAYRMGAGSVFSTPHQSKAAGILKKIVPDCVRIDLDDYKTNDDIPEQRERELAMPFPDFEFQFRKIAKLRDVLKVFLDEGYIVTEIGFGHQLDTVNACIVCKGEAEQRFTAMPKAIVCRDPECVSALGALFVK